jgi:hypothetical protein
LAVKKITKTIVLRPASVDMAAINALPTPSVVDAFQQSNSNGEKSTKNTEEAAKRPYHEHRHDPDRNYKLPALRQTGCGLEIV